MEKLVATPIDVINREFIAPVMAQEGFKRRGRVYRQVSADHDWVLAELTLKGSLGDGFVRFSMAEAVGPAPELRFSQGLPPGAVPNEPLLHLMEQTKASPLPPPIYQHADHSPNVWKFDPEVELEECGAAFAAAVHGQTVERLKRYLDRKALVEALMNRTLREIIASDSRPALTTTILFVLDHAPVKDVESLLTGLANELRYAAKFVPFVRAELDARINAGDINGRPGWDGLVTLDRAGGYEV